MREKKFVILMAFLTLIFGIGLGSSVTEISSCQTISSPGEYVLNQSLVATDTCFIIDSDDVILDLGGFSVTSNDFPFYNGIEATSQDNISIKNGSIYDFGRGIEFSGISNSSISNFFINSSYGNGILISSSQDNNLSNIIVSYSNATSGIYLGSNSNNIILTNITSNSNAQSGFYFSSSFKNNIFNDITTNSNTEYGIYFGGSSDNNTFSGITANSNSFSGIYVYASLNNIFSEVTTISNDDAGIFLGYNSVNTTLSGVVSSSNVKGILLHPSSTNNSISDSTLSSNTQGVYLNSSSGNILFDLAVNSNTHGIYLNSSWNNTLANITSNSNTEYGIYLLGNSTNNTLSNITSISDATGIYLSSSWNNTLTNITATLISNAGISLYLSLNNLISNINSSSNDGGIILSSSSNNTLSNIVANSNMGVGIGLSYLCSNNIFSNVSSIFNNAGISLYGGSNNVFYNVIGSNSRDSGIKLQGALNNTFSNVISNSNDDYGAYLVSSSENNNFSNVTFNSNRYGVYLTLNASNNTFSNLTSSLNYGGVYADWYSSYNVFSNVVFDSNAQSVISSSPNLNNSINNSSIKHNINSSLIRSNFIDEDFERVYNQNEEISFDFNITLFNGTGTANYDYNFSIYPFTIFSSSNNSENVSVNFTPEKEGIYTLSLNVTTLDDNNTEIRNFVFLIGNSTNSSVVRFYMHEEKSTHGLPRLTAFGSSSMFSYPTTSDEMKSGSSFVTFRPDEVVNQYFLIKNISVGWQHNSTSIFNVNSLVQRYHLDNTEGDYVLPLPTSLNMGFNTTNFTDLNITSDYAWRFYWLALKLVGNNVHVKSDVTQQSYADFTYLYTGPKIEEFREVSGSDIRNMRLLSSIWNNNARTNASLEFEGEGDFTITLNLSSADNTVLYDGVSCSLNSDCTVNSNLEGIVNLTLSLGSYHYLDVYETPVSTPIVTEDVDPGTTGSGSFNACSYTISEDLLNQGYENIFEEDCILKFSFRGEDYSFVLNDLFENGKNINFSINHSGEIKEYFMEKKIHIDLDLNNYYYDLSLISFQINSSSQIKLFFEIVNQEIPESSGDYLTFNSSNESSQNFFDDEKESLKSSSFIGKLFKESFFKGDSKNSLQKKNSYKAYFISIFIVGILILLTFSLVYFTQKIRKKIVKMMVGDSGLPLVKK